MITKKYLPPLVNTPVIIHVGTHKEYAKKIAIAEEVIADDTASITEVDDGYYLFFLAGTCQEIILNNLVHETTHLISYLSRDYNLTLGLNAEWEAYYRADVFFGIWDIIKKEFTE